LRTPSSARVWLFVQHADNPTAHYKRGRRYQFQAIRASPGWRLSRVEVTPVWTSDGPGA